MALTGELPGWDRPAVLDRLREAFGPSLAVENDVDAAALAERALGRGREADSFAFISVGTGIGMGLVLGGQLARGAHGVAGEIAYMPMSGGAGTDEDDARRRGALEASASASAVVRAARRAGMRGQVSARRVFAAAARATSGPRPWWRRRPAGRPAAVRRGHRHRPRADRARRRHRPGARIRRRGDQRARAVAPVMPEVSVSALGTEAVVHGCLAAGTELAWTQLTSAIPPTPGPDDDPAPPLP